MHTTSPLSALRHWLEASHLDGMIVPRADAWQSEYCAPYDEKLAWLTGFDGSAGLALVLKDKALLFVDGRYQVQARVQVNMDDTIFTTNRWLSGWRKTSRQGRASPLTRC